jgi:ubiquinone biosynthesis protein
MVKRRIGRAGRFEQLVGVFLRAHESSAERIDAVQTALESPMGGQIRDELGKWIIRLVPVEALVPEIYREWRPLVRNAMRFVVSRLSNARLAPKIVEQLELAVDTPPELRLLNLISRVPGLQKIGQVLARNRHLHPPLRRALAELENGISDIGIEEIRGIVLDRLGPRIARYSVELDSEILSEASVSAVVRFTWRNPATRRRERGVFKVMKPYIPGCYAEDMKILQDLAVFLARKHRAGSIRLAGVAETLTEIRLLLEHEVDFRREQTTLLKALRIYRSAPGIRVPRLIPALSTPTMTALTEEDGVKVTAASTLPRAGRARLAERLVQALVAVPWLARQHKAIFHADPHAGNLLYDQRRGELVILDWALTESLDREQRRNIVILVAMMVLRDAAGIRGAIERLLETRTAGDGASADIIRRRVDAWLDELPLFGFPGAMDALRLLDAVALEGIKFPAALAMFRKAVFTLDGVLEDIAGARVRMDTAIADYALAHWVATTATLFSLLSPADWIALEWSALTFAARVWARAVFRTALPGVAAR